MKEEKITRKNIFKEKKTLKDPTQTLYIKKQQKKMKDFVRKKTSSFSDDDVRGIMKVTLT